MAAPCWPRLRHLFEVDDGSLPDIFIEDLSPEQILAVHEWLVDQCAGTDDSTLWSIGLQQNALVWEVVHPARGYVLGKAESFRHGLVGLQVGGVELPLLTVGVESGGLSLDYRMGPGWNERTLCALLQLLRQVLVMVPDARVLHADEGCYARPNLEFTQALRDYAAGAGDGARHSAERGS